MEANQLRRLWISGRVVFAVIAIFFVVRALRHALSDFAASPIPSLAFSAVAVIAVVLGLIAAAYSWEAVVTRHVKLRRGLHAGFYLSQLAKYVPGSLWQPVGQVGTAMRAGVPGSVATFGTLLHVVAQLSAAGILTLVLIVAPPDVAMPRWVFATALFPLPWLNRRWLSLVLQILRRRGVEVEERHLADWRAMLTSLAWCIVNLTLFGIAFGALVSSFPESRFTGQAFGAFAAAWMVGFLVFPVPSGLGVREAALVFFMQGAAPTAAVLSAAVFLRVVSLGGELVLASIAWLLAGRRGRR